MYVECPNCKGIIEIIEINCGIFRHGANKIDGCQINPHASKTTCDNLLEKDSIYGCGKPFRLIFQNAVYRAILCDYI